MKSRKRCCKQCGGLARTIAFVGALSIGLALVPAVGGARIRSGTRTIATIYRPSDARGRERRASSRDGYCWTSSETAQRRDAWRCTTGNYIRDPCFSLVREPNRVLCPEGPWNSAEIRLRLSRPLPFRYANRRPPSIHVQPWALELADGRRCRLASGASNVLHGVRLNYFCNTSGDIGLWGYPNRSHEPWTILAAPYTATELTDHLSVRRAWM